MSIERRILAQAYGAQLELTPAQEGMQGAIKKAQELSTQISNSWIPQQFDNSDNPDSHQATVDEILNDLQQIDYLISAVGSGGNISGCGKYLRQHFPQLKIYAVEPTSSAVISGKQAGAHKIQGIGAGFIPQNLDQKLLTGTITVSDQDAFTMTQQFTKETGVLVGISTGAVLQAIKQQLPHIKDNSTLLTINYDTGERYLSVDNLFT
jgi:cysteine synthase A